MSQAFVTVKGDTPKQVRKKLENRAREAKNIGLHEEARTEPKLEEPSGYWKATIVFHN